VGDAKTHTMKTTVQISIAGVALEVEGFFTPEEPQTREDTGMSAEFEVESVTLVNRGDDIFELLVSTISMEDIADAALEALGERETPDDYWGGF
jgi:hypothetical protein